MKKLLFTLLLLAGVSYMVSAVPARPGKIRKTQPNGSVIVLENHGDEYFHWLTDENGRVVEKGADGFYHPVDESVLAARRARGNQLRTRKATWSSYENHPETNFGNRKVLCLLANFTDSTFVIDNPKEKFSNMLNQENYSYDGAIGSVRDYYKDNSNGKYLPEFDVYGPVTLSQSSNYYDKNGAYRAILEAYELLASQININDYDTDNDGAIDMVLFYYPGHNEAEGADEESIWPHQNSSNFGEMGGKTFNRYFCTSELQGSRGTTMCAIGTTCHEFAHSLGLPDFYDTDYETNGKNQHTTGQFDLMSSGNYNDNGRRPPYLSILERNMLGWTRNLLPLEAGNVTIPPVRDTVAYVTPCAMDGEYFILECRDNNKWDSALPSEGLLLYHVDKSSRTVPGSGKTAAYLWAETNRINVYGGHPCYYLYDADGSGFYSFPGPVNISSVMLKDWDDHTTGVLLTDISFDGSAASFTVTVASDRMMAGYVRNSTGSPISGAQLVLRRSAYPFSAAPALFPGDLLAETDANGFYSITLPSTASNEQILVVSKEGYVPVCMNVATVTQITEQPIYLPRIGEGTHQTLQRYDISLSPTYTRMGVSDFAAGICYPAAEIAAQGLAGKRLESISFMATPSTYDKVYAVAYFHGDWALLRDVTVRFVPGAFQTFDVSDANVVIPDDSDLYVGYAITGVDVNEYNILMYGPGTTDVNGTHYNRTFPAVDGWRKPRYTDKDNNDIYFALAISAEVSDPKEPALSDYGVAYILLSGDVPTVVPPAGKTVYTTQWFLDGTEVSAPAAISTHAAGDHTYKVRLTYYDGSVESVFYDFSL